ncbi:MAG: hypothetical protein SNJ53_00400 [Thermodesulfovibrionales bacterium]
MSDSNPVLLQTHPIKQHTEHISREGLDHSKKADKPFDERPVVLTIENPSKEKTDLSKQIPKTPENEILLKDVKKVSLSYSDEGFPIVKFLDSKGNTVLQVPPEEYLRLKEESKMKDGEKVPDIVNKKI